MTAMTNEGKGRKPVGIRALQVWSQLGPRYLPFADVASKDLPLGRLMRLSLFKVTMGITTALLIAIFRCQPSLCRVDERWRQQCCEDD